MNHAIRFPHFHFAAGNDNLGLGSGYHHRNHRCLIIPTF
jgi:hypothetical protein